MLPKLHEDSILVFQVIYFVTYFVITPCIHTNMGADTHSDFGFENGLVDYLLDLSFDIQRDPVPLDWHVAVMGLNFALKIYILSVSP